MFFGSFDVMGLASIIASVSLSDQGPRMSAARNDFGCARFFSVFHQSWMVGVFGGMNSEFKTNTVELYFKDSWIEGPEMPYNEYWYGGAIVANPQQNGVIVTGGYSRNGYETMLTEMSCLNTGCHWKIWNTSQLQAPRLYHVAFLLSKNTSHNCTQIG